MDGADDGVGCLDCLGNGTEFFEFVSRESVTRGLGVTSSHSAIGPDNSSSLEVFGSTPQSDPCHFITCPVYHNSSIQGVLVAHRPDVEGKKPFIADDFSLLTEVASHVGRIFSEVRKEGRVAKQRAEKARFFFKGHQRPTPELPCVRCCCHLRHDF